jgi:hypothetical protein
LRVRTQTKWRFEDEVERLRAAVGRLEGERQALRDLLADAQHIVNSANFVDTGALKHRIAAALAADGERGTG